MAGLYPDSPNAPNYAAPLLDFAPLGNLGNDFYQGAANQLGYDKARAFQQGLPRDASGNINFSAVADTLARHGDISQVVPLANVELDRRLIDTAMRASGLDTGPGGAPAGPGGSSGPAPGAPGQGMPQTAGTAPGQRVAASASAAPPPQLSIPAHGIPTAGAPSKNSVPGGDDGETSLMSIVTSKVGNDADAGPIALKIAQALKLDPNATNDPAKAANLAKYVDGYLTRNGVKGQGAAAGAAPAPVAQASPAAPGPQPAPVAAAPAGGAADPLAGILPPGITRENAPAFLDQLRRRAAALALSPRTAAMGKQYEDQAKAIETALQPTGGQKEAYASGQMTPLQYENAKVVAKVAAENGAKTPEQKLYQQAIDQGFQGTELDFQAYREQLKGGNFKVIGKDANGNDVHGFVNGKDKTVTPYAVPGSVPSAATSGLTGDDFLATVDPGRANQIRAIADGRMAPPGAMALRSPQIQSLMRDVAQYEPGFDLTSWKARNDTRADLAKGKMGQNISSFNTAIGHLETLDKAATDLGNTWSPQWNKLGNAILTMRGDPRIQRFEIARSAVADELTRAFRGTGGNVHDLQQWETAINSAGSPDQLREAVRQAVDLLQSRIEAVGDQYSRGMGKTTDPLTLLSPKARAGIAHLTGHEPPAPVQPQAAMPADRSAIAAARANPQDALNQARAAIASGKPRDAVIERLKQVGVDPSGL